MMQASGGKKSTFFGFLGLEKFIFRTSSNYSGAECAVRVRFSPREMKVAVLGERGGGAEEELQKTESLDSC